MKKIEAKIVADSISPQGHRITSFLLTYPRIIHGELMTHRMFSRNSASSRAIPFEKMVKMVEEDPFIPIAWQKDHKGMQGVEYITDQKIIRFKTGVWLNAKRKAVESAKELHYNVSVARSIDDIKELDGTSVTKQLCNRLLEPFMWHTVLVTFTEISNFFELRCPKYQFKGGSFFPAKKELLAFYPEAETLSTKEWYSINSSQAEIHIQALAESMWDAINESNPKKLEAGEWHIPFGDKMSIALIIEQFRREPYVEDIDKIEKLKIKVATARCARLSYMTFDGDIDYEKDIKLHDQLLRDGHMSPFEHCARAMNNAEYFSHFKGNKDWIFTNESKFSKAHGWCNNFQGWIQYRYLVENENKI